MLCSFIQMGKKKITFGLKVFLIVIEILTLIGILGGAWLINKVSIAPPLIISLRLVRLKIEERYEVFHLTNIYGCMLLSIFVSLIGVYISLPSNISLVSNILVGVIFAIATWKIQDYIDLKHKYSAKDEFIDKCRELNYTPLNTEIAVKLFLEHQKPKDVWLWLCETQENPISWDYLYNLKSKMKKDLF